jgi:AraC family transcriptional regulator of adaptative response/methylated-DNA-[protein]-cysteine methyltransferase
MLGALNDRDAAYDGVFYYAIRTTGVYCLPSCPSRAARVENVSFYGSIEEAERAGYRPCKRCRPNDGSYRERTDSIVCQACRTLETSNEPPSLAALASAAGMSSHHFHRLFKAATGTTPKAYYGYQRAHRLKSELAGGQLNVSETYFEAGFSSSSRFYSTSNEILGMMPRQYRLGGKDIMVRFTVAESSLGPILIASSAKGICEISMGDDAGNLVRELQSRFPKAFLVDDDEDFENSVAAVLKFVDNPSLGISLPLDIRGTAFQVRVWDALRRIPCGTASSYSEIAAALGSPTAVRAVASACAANKIALAIPCHRVIKTDGSISGYRWGVERKRELLRREQKSGG